MNFVGKFDAKLPVDGWSAHQDAQVHHIESSATHVPADAIIVPDTHLLFEGNYKRAGVDLVISNDERELVLHDYFKGEKRATLSSPDGAHLTGDIVNALSGGHVEYAQAAGAPAAGEVIGHVTKLTGSATAIRNGVSIILNQGDNVEKGDVIESGSNSTVGVTFKDGSVFGLSSNARMVLNEMIYDPKGSNNSSLISLVAGTISFVAGDTAKHGDMKVDTPVATMGIRGTAVLVEIDFSVPGQNGSPSADFQVLVEPDGSTGSYILFDKQTLAPIATVNQAGQLLSIHDGTVTVSNASMTPDIQKLINDVFTQKFTDNTNQNTKTATNFNDSITPQYLQTITLANGTSATAVVVPVNSPTNAVAGPPPSVTPPIAHVPGPPAVTVTGDHFSELKAVTGSSALDTASGFIVFKDINVGDQPTASATFASYTYQNAHGDTISLTNTEAKDILATEIGLSITQDPAHGNNGTALWSYSLADNAFDFLGAGDTLTLTYNITVNTNYALDPETTTEQITITIAGTNDVPVITSSVPTTIAFSGGTSVPGGDLTAKVPTSGTIGFKDVDLTDTHKVSVDLASAVLDGSALPPTPLSIFENALSASIGTDSTGTGLGTVNWKLADLPVWVADFIPKGETLTLTYAVTVTDSQGATATQDITVTITGTDTPAVVWIATTTTGQAPGGLWSDASNWETGTVPTANDDVIIITDQLAGLTPSYPVTIDSAAFAKSLTMDDFGSPPPELINDSTLTVSGLMEVLDQSVLQNSGTITLEGGGDFKDESSITNNSTGLIEIAGGTLNVQVDMTNAGHVTVDAGAALTIGAYTVANKGGTITIDGTGTMTLDGTAIDGGTIDDYSLVSGKIVAGEIDVTGSSTISHARLHNGEVTIEAGQTLTLRHDEVTGTSFIDTADGAAIRIDGHTTLDDVSVTGGAITDLGTIHIDSGKTLKLDGVALSGGAISNAGTIEITGTGSIDNDALGNHQLTVDSDQTLTLDGTTVTGGTVTDHGTVNVDADQTLKLDGVALSGGTISNAGTIEITGTGSIENDAFSNTQLTIDSDQTLTLEGTTVTGGTVTDHGTINVDADQTLKLSGVALSGGAISSAGTIEITGTGSIDNDAFGNDQLTVDSEQTLTLDGTTVTGGAITDNGIITIDAEQTLKLDGVALSGGAISNVGTIEITGSGSIDNDAFNNTQLTIDSDQTLTLDGTTVTGGTVTDHGTIHVDADQTLKLSGVALSGGAISNAGTIEITGTGSIENDTFGNNQLTVDSEQTLTLDGTTVTGGAITDNGTITIDAEQTLKLDGVALSGGAISNVGTIEITGSGSIDNDALDNHQLTVDSDQTLTLDGTTVTGGTITDNGTIDVDASETLKLDGVALSGGAITSAGTIEITTTGSIENDTFGNNQLTVDSGQTLTLDGTTVTGGAITDNGTINVDAELTLSGVALSGGAITNAGTIEITGSGSIENDAFSNTQLTIDSDQTLTLDGTTVSGGTITDNGTINVDAEQTLKLSGVALTGGAITSAGSIEIITTGSIDNDALDNHQLTVDSGQTLTLDGTTITGGTITNTGATLQVDADTTLTLKGGVTVVGGTLFNDGTVKMESSSGAALDGVTVTGTGTLQIDTPQSPAATPLVLEGGTSITGGKLSIGPVGPLAIKSALGATLNDVDVTNGDSIEIFAGSVLVLDQLTTVDNSVGTIAIDGTAMLTLDAARITGGTIDDYSVVSGSMVAGDIDITGSSAIDGAYLNDGHVTIESGQTLTLDGDTVTGTSFTDTASGAVIQIDGGTTLKLSGVTIAGGAIDDYSVVSGQTLAGDIDVTGSSKISGGSLTNGQVTIEAGQTLTLDNDTVTGTSFADTASGAVIQIDGGTTLKLSGVAITGGTIDDFSVVSGQTVAGDIDISGSSKLLSVALNNGRVTIEAGQTLTLDGDMVVTGTSFDDTAEGATIQIDGGSKLTLSGACISGGTVNDYSVVSGSTVSGDIDVTGYSSIENASLNQGDVTIESGVTLTLDGDTVSGTVFTDTVVGALIGVDVGTTLTLQGGSFIAGGVLADAGTLDIEGALGATLDGVTVVGSGTIQVDGDLPGPSVLTLEGGTTITAGKLAIGSLGTLAVKTVGGATLNDVDITNGNAIEVFAGSFLVLDQLTTIDNSVGTITVDGTALLTLNDVSITGGIINDFSTVSGSIVGGDIDVAGSSAIDDASLNNGHVSVESGVTLTLDDVTVNGTSISDMASDAVIQIEQHDTLTLNDASIIGGTINDFSVATGRIISGDIDIAGSSKISEASLNHGHVTIEAGQTLTIDNVTVTGTWLHATADSAAIQVDGGTTLTLNDVRVYGGDINDYSMVSGSVVAGDIDIAGSSLIVNANLNQGNVTIEAGQTLTLFGDVATGTSFDDTADGATIQVDAVTALTLDGSSITGGAIDNHGPNQFGVDAGSYIFVTGSSTISDASLNDGNVTTEMHQTLTLDNVTVAGTTFDTYAGSSIQVDGGTTLTLDDVSMSGGTINDYSLVAGKIIAGTIDISGSSTISGATLNNGNVTIEDGQTLTLTNVNVHNATFTFEGSGTLDISQPSTFAGEVAGITGTGETLDLGTLSVAHGSITAQSGDVFETSASYNSVTNTTVLTVIDETQGNASASVTLAGNYSSTPWSVTADGHGGVDVNEAPPSPTVTITVLTPNGMDFADRDVLAYMGSGTLQSESATSFTTVDIADNVEFVVEGSNFTYGSEGATVTGGTLTSFEEFTADGKTALATFTGISVDAATWMADVQQDALGNGAPLKALTDTFSYDFIGNSGPDTFGSAHHGPDGSETLTGGGGVNTFVFSQGDGATTITDFDQGSGTFNASQGDLIELNNFNGVKPTVTYVNGNTVADFGHGDVLTLLNVTPAEIASLDGSEFVYNNNGGGNNGPTFTSMTLAVTEGGTTVLTNGDFNVSETGVTNFTYSVQNVTGGQFEVYNGTSWTAAPTGGFTTAQIAAGDVEFVQDGTTTAPSFQISASDGSNVSAPIAPTVEFAAAPVVTFDTAAPTFNTIDVPGATFTDAYAINNVGQIVGLDDTSGWEASGNSFTAVSYPGAFETTMGGINDSGEIVGSYLSSSEGGVTVGSFSLINGVYATLDLPSNYSLIGINDAGVIVGNGNSNGNVFGFIDDNGSITTLSDPNAIGGVASGGTTATAINNVGDVVGYYDNMHGFLYQDGTYTTIDDPNGVNGTFVEGINDAGEVVGNYLDANHVEHGFVESGGIYTTIDDPLGAKGTFVYGINNADQIVGTYIDANGVDHGFISSINATSTAENTPVLLTSVSVSDAAAGTNPIEVSLAVKDGVLALNDTTGLGVSFDAGHDTVTLTGSVAAIDAALASGVIYTPDNGFTGTDTLTVTANDQGNTAVGIAQSTMQTLDIPVIAPVSAPVAGDLAFTFSGNSSGYSASLTAHDSAPNGDAFTVTAATYDGAAATFNQADGAYEVSGASGELFIYPEAVSGVTVGGYNDASVNAGDFVFVPDSDPGNLIHHLAPGVTDTEVFTYTITDAVTGLSSTAVVDLTLSDSDIFTGAVGTSWTNGGNWMFGVPTSSMVAYIGSGMTVDASGVVMSDITLYTADSSSTIVIDQAATLTLESGTTISGGTLTVSQGSILDIEYGANGPGATLDGVDVNNAGTVKVDFALAPTSTLTLEDGATITGGTLTIGTGSTLEIAYGSSDTGATLDGVAVSNSGIINIGTTALNDPTLKLVDGTTVTGGTLSINSNSALDIDVGSGSHNVGATLDGVTVDATDSSSVIMVGNEMTLTLHDTTVHGGTIDDYSSGFFGVILPGDIDVTGSSAIENTGLYIGDVTIEAGQTLKMDGDKVTGTTFADTATGAIIQVDGNTTLTLADATIDGGTIKDFSVNASGQMIAGDIDVVGSSTISDANINHGNVTIEGGQTLTLSGVTINGGIIDDYSTNASGQIIAGDIDITGSSKFLGGASLNGGHVTIESGQTLTLGSGAVDGTIITFAADGTLAINNPANFAGEIAHISGSSDVLDLGNFNAAQDTVVASTGSGSFDATTDTTSLVVADQTTGQSVTLTLVGDYSNSSWNVTGDGHGGADIVDPPAPSSATIATGGSLEFTSSASSENVTFHGSTGELTLDHASGFTGIISGFTGDGTLADSDQIDLKGIDYHSSSFTESFDVAHDTLSVSDGTNSATLHFTGSYQAANFEFATDGNGGTIVYDPPVPSSAGSQPPATHTPGSNGQGFVFNFSGGMQLTGDPHLTDVTGLTKQLALDKLNDAPVAGTVGNDGHDALGTPSIVKAQWHAHDFHFV